MNTAILKVKNLTYRYENKEGISDVTFEVEKGDFLAIIGKSGAGKSTLINTILGLLDSQEGEVLIDEDLFARDISYSPQSQAIDWYLNVFDNVYMGALFSDVDNATEVTKNIIENIGLQGKKDEDPTNLSGGQLQRIQLARQLSSDSKILILDEPTSSLDVITSEMILEQLHEKTLMGTTCLVSSHDLDMLEKYCNKVLFIEKGNVSFFGTLENFLDRYGSYNEFAIKVNGELPPEVKEFISEKANVIDWNPLSIEIKEKETINEILQLFINKEIVVESVVQNKKTLKEIIRLRG